MIVVLLWRSGCQLCAACADEIQPLAAETQQRGLNPGLNPSLNRPHHRTRAPVRLAA
jgi:hypothetical protein